VFAVLQSPEIEVPLGWLPFTGVEDAVEVFVGYLMLDAWIANTDRHHENWALVVHPQATKHLAPSYDHAASLGAHETDKNRQDRLTTRDQGRAVPRYVARAASAFFASPTDRKPMTTLAVFRAVDARRPEAVRAWLARLERISPQAIQGILADIPPDWMSPVAMDFALSMLTYNRQRLLAL